MDFKSAFISAGNDYSSALERVAGDADLLNDLMLMFLADDNFTAMKSNMDAGETEKAFRAAHSLKGSSGMLGMTMLYEAMVKITDELRHGNLQGAVELYPSVDIEYCKIVELINGNV